MGFDDFDVVLVPEGLRHLADDFVDEIHAHAHVWGKDTGYLLPQ